MRQSGILQVPFIKALTSITFVLVIIHTWISLSRPAPEDQMLQGALGEEWETWAKKVRYRLVPGIY